MGNYLELDAHPLDAIELAAIWLWVETNGIPFWGTPPILEPILVGIGMFTGGSTGF